MTKYLIAIISALIIFLGVGFYLGQEESQVILGAPVGTVLRSVIPETNNTYYLGTTSPRTYWANIYTNTLTVTSGTATTTISAGDSLATFAYPFTGVSSVLNATTSGLRIASSSVLGVLNVGTLNATSSITTNNLTINGTCTGCSAVTTNSGIASRVAYYSAASTIDSFNGLITGSDGTGSTTIASNLTVTSIYASSTVRITGALTLDTALTVPNGGTGVTSCTDGGVMLGSGTGAVTCTSVLADGEILVGDGTTDPVAESGATLRTSIGVGTGDSPTFTGLTLTTLTVNGASTLSTSTVQGYFNTGIIVATSSIRTNNFTVTGTLSLPADSVTNAMVSDTLTASDLVAGSSVVSNAEVDNDLTISGGTIDNSVIGGTTAAAGTFTNLTVTASSTFSGTGRNTFQGTQYFGGSLGISTSTPTFGLTIGNPNLSSGSASSSPLVPECRFTVTGSITVDLSLCVNSRILAVGNVTLALSNIRAGVSGKFALCQDTTGGRTFTFDNSVMRVVATTTAGMGISQTIGFCNWYTYAGTIATGTTPIVSGYISDAW